MYLLLIAATLLAPWNLRTATEKDGLLVWSSQAYTSREECEEELPYAARSLNVVYAYCERAPVYT